jgi:heme-degrading monooxygenase HmoA
MPLVSVTRLRVRSLLYMPFFAWSAMRSSRQARAAEGSLSVRMLADAHRAFWTVTVWRDEAAMRRFMLAGAHGRAMRKLMEWCNEASVARWEQESPAAPGWQEAYERMQREGRRSKVLHPSADHQAYRIEPPAAGFRGAVQFK